MATSTAGIDEPVIWDTPTPLVPAPESGQAYRLRAYPDTLGPLERGYHDHGYYSAYQYAVYAEQDALARFPAAAYASEWTWDAAFNQAQMGDSGALDTYARLIEEALQTGTTDLETLPDWFGWREPRLELSAETAPDQPGQILTVADPWRSSGGFLWVLGAGPAARVFPLHAEGVYDYYDDFSFTSAQGIAVSGLDSTGDGQQDVVTHHLWMPGGPNVQVENLDIFDLSVVPPRTLAFSPDLSEAPTRGITASVDATGAPTLQFDYLFDPMFCESTYSDLYRWDGTVFVRTERRYPPTWPSWCKTIRNVRMKWSRPCCIRCEPVS